jgi:DNA-binding CsgD family transcriptional regulator
VSAPCFAIAPFRIRGLRVVERGRRHDISGSGDKSIELRLQAYLGVKGRDSFALSGME